MSNILAQWLSDNGLMPLAHAWPPELLSIYLVSDAVIGLSFYAISAALIYLARKRNSNEFNWVFMMFAVFIMAGGTATFVSLWSILHPHPWLAAGVNIVTAISSFATALLLWPLLPRIAQLPSRTALNAAIAQLEVEVEERKKAEEALRRSEATLRELAAYQENIREDERKRIAREIHDELGQNLLALRLDVSALHARAGARHPFLQQRIGAALEYIDTTMKSIRTIMNNLRPAVLDLGLQAAIEWQVAQFERRCGISCELMMNDDGLRVTDTQAIAVFRILQESLTNIGRHAHATYARVELRVDDRHLTMAVKDNGTGMYPGDRRKLRRFGLIGIQERVNMLGGELSIDTKPGHGTTLQVVIPMQANTQQPRAEQETDSYAS